MVLPKILKGFLAAAATAGTVFASSPVAAGDGVVQYVDLRGEDALLIKDAPHFASKGKTAIVAYGGKDDVLAAMYAAAQHVETLTDENIVFLHAPDNNGNPDITEFAIYTRGQHTGTITAGSNPQPERVLSELQQAVSSGVQRVSPTTIPTPSED